MTASDRLLTALSLLALGACAGSSGDTAATTPAPAAQQPAAQQPAPAQPAAEPSGAFFTQAQATRGRTVFRSVCSECHYTSEFNSEDFKYSWRRRQASALFDYMSDAMPEDAPGSLTSQQYLDVLTYILDLNGFPTGDSELSADALGSISLAPLSGD